MAEEGLGNPGVWGRGGLSGSWVGEARASLLDSVEANSHPCLGEEGTHPVRRAWGGSWRSGHGCVYLKRRQGTQRKDKIGLKSRQEKRLFTT